MKPLRNLVAVLLAVLWLPCTMHCQAEALGWLGGESACCEHGHAENSAAPDCEDCTACQTLESDGYSLPQQVSFVHALLAVESDTTPDGITPVRVPTAVLLPACDDPPQLLRQSWSFRCRTALAPRAPSFLA